MRKIASILLCVLLTFSFLLAAPLPVRAEETDPIPVAQFVADSHVLMTRADGRILGWGDNTYGQLGLGEESEKSYTTPVEITFFKDKGKIKQIAAIKDTSFVLLNSGELYSAGSGTYGKHGQGDTYDKTEWGRVGGELKFKKLYTNGAAEFCLAEDYNGSLYAWGKNSDGQLGVGDTNARTSPTLVKASANIKEIWLGETYAEYIDLDNNVYYWGTFNGGQDGLQYSYNVIHHSQYRWSDGSGYNADETSTTIKAISTASTPKLTLYTLGALPPNQSRPSIDRGETGTWYTYSWNTKSLLVTNTSALTNIHAGSAHSLLVYNGLIYGWGDVSKKQLATQGQVSAPTVITAVNELISNQKTLGVDLTNIFVDRNSNYLTFSDGSVWVWGDNSFNKSGISGAPLNISTPSKIDALQDKMVVKVVAGRDTNYYITENGEIYATGSNVNGVSGLGEDYKDEATIDTPTKIDYLGFSETLEPPTAPVQITVPERAEEESTIEVMWDAVPDATNYELKRTVTMRSNAMQITSTAPTLVYDGEQTAYNDTAKPEWESVAYELQAKNAIGDYSSPVLSSTVPITLKSNDDDNGGGGNGDGDNGGGNGDGNNGGGNVVQPPVNVTVNPPDVTVQSPDIRVNTPEIKLPDYPEIQNYPSNNSPPSSTTNSALSSWLPTPAQLQALGLGGGNTGNANMPYVITIQPSTPQYIQPPSSDTGNNTVMYVIIFVLIAVIIAIVAFLSASMIFNKNSGELHRIRFMLSELFDSNE